MAKAAPVNSPDKLRGDGLINGLAVRTVTADTVAAAPAMATHITPDAEAHENAPYSATLSALPGADDRAWIPLRGQPTQQRDPSHRRRRRRSFNTAATGSSPNAATRKFAVERGVPGIGGDSSHEPALVQEGS